MRYANDEVRDKLHKSNTMLQTICSLIEGYFFKFYLQVDVEEVLKQEGETITVLKIPGLMNRKETMDEVCRMVNEQYKRKDDAPTCEVQSYDRCELLIYTTTALDLSQLI